MLLPLKEESTRVKKLPYNRYTVPSLPLQNHCQTSSLRSTPTTSSLNQSHSGAMRDDLQILTFGSFQILVFGPGRKTQVGTVREVQSRAIWIEDAGHFSWQNKIPKLVWRGATMGLRLRDQLLEVSAGKSWADVVALDWHNKESITNDLKSMPEHCQYKYLAHTEGNSYSGRLKYLQACRSVVIAHKMDWIQHYYPLMHSSGPDQNYVEVDRDFDKLETTILDLEKHDREAERIASNSVKTFRERYLTPAAEACYWRYLIHGWAEVSFQPDFYKDVNGTIAWRGLPIESFLLEGRLKWDPY